MQLLDTGPSPRGWHRLQTVLMCPQQYAFNYEYGEGGLEGKAHKSESPALIRGSMMHLALAHHYIRVKCEQQGKNPNEWFPPKDALEMKAVKMGDAWEQELDRIKACYDHYITHYSFEKLKILEVERLAYTKIGEFLFTGRFDLVYEDSSGGVWVCDHKTTSRVTSSQKKFYGVSGQLIGYAYMGREIYGDRFKGMILNQIQHTPPCKFMRIQLPPAPNLMRQFPQIVIDAETRIKELKESGRSPNQWPMAANELTCFHRYGACKFLDNCRWGAEPPVDWTPF